MIRALFARLSQGFRTIDWPNGPPPELPPRFRGRPNVHPEKCVDGCRECISACPTNAITVAESKPVLDLGRCLFCTDCTSACPTQAIEFTRDFRLATDARDELLVTGEVLRLAQGLDAEAKRIFGRSLKLRQVSAGGCNGCEADVNVLSTIGFDLLRFGIQFVASPRHADGLLITGPVTKNMQLALKKTYDAIPDPKIVIVVGACAISGGPYVGHDEANDGASSIVPVDLFVPGCPPHPLTILDGLLRLLGRIDGSRERA